MCQEDEEIKNILSQLVQSWDKSENRIKNAERIRAEVSQAAINELRYGGRRLIDALKVYLDPEYSGDPNIFKTHLIEAKECAIKAEHDAIDAIIFYVDKHLRYIEEKFDPDVIHKFSPEYIIVKTKLLDVSKLIEESREDRRNRYDLYDTIEKDHLETIITFHRTLTISEELMIVSAIKESRLKNLNTFFGISGLIGIVFTIVTYFL